MKRFLVILFFSCFMINVNAVSSSENVGSDLTEYSCSAFQEESKAISGDTYFARCMESQCDGSKWNLKYYENKTVTCKNGNLNPYTKITKDGCDDYRGNSCRGSSRKYCTTITYFDCDRTSNGSKFTTTTKTTKTTTKTTTRPKTSQTTQTTQATKNNNTYLSSIELSVGSINFNKETKEYSINVGSDVSYITVVATAEAETSKVSVSGNTNLIFGSNKINVTVTAEDGSQGTYIINVNKEESFSNNTKLNFIKINGESLKDFNSTKYNYVYETKDKSLNIDAETEDIGAVYKVSGANEVVNGSEVLIEVTAEDGITTQTYRITISVPNNSSTIVTVIFVIILVVVVGGGIYYFYTRKKNGGEKEYEYE